MMTPDPRVLSLTPQVWPECRPPPAEGPQPRLATTHRVAELVPKNLEHPGADTVKAVDGAHDRLAGQRDRVGSRPGPRRRFGCVARRRPA